MHVCANISMLFCELPMAERFAAAAAAGFDGVEIQFPDEDDPEALAQARARAAIPVTLINLPRGGADAVGLGALPGREAEFDAAVETVVHNARLLGAEKVNVLAGRPPRGASPDDCRATFARNLRHAADRLGREGVRVMVEPVNGRDVPGFFLSDLASALDLLERVDHANLFLQFDLYHMALSEPDLAGAIRRAGRRIGHVQFADAPGRGAPGSGTIDFAAALAALRGSGYTGAVSAEYRAGCDTATGLDWMTRFRELMR